MKISAIVKSIFIYLISFFILFTLLTSAVIFIFKWINPPTTAFIQSKSSLGIIVSTNDYKYDWKNIDKTSPHFPLAVIASEDQLFFEHNGFDVVQIQKAIDEIESGRRVRGASTITQQVAKNLFLWEDKSFIRKGFEAYFTVLIELIWSKKRILEVYINICELGKNIYGIEAASKYYFNKSSERLTQGEAALMAVVLPRPSVRNPAKPSHYMMNRRENILRQMNNLGGKEMLRKKL